MKKQYQNHVHNFHFLFIFFDSQPEVAASHLTRHTFNTEKINDRL